MTTPLTEEDTRAEEARILTIIAIQGITPPGISINTPSLASDSDDSHVSISSSDSSDHGETFALRAEGKLSTDDFSVSLRDHAILAKSEHVPRALPKGPVKISEAVRRKQQELPPILVEHYADVAKKRALKERARMILGSERGYSRSRKDSNNSAYSFDTAVNLNSRLPPRFAPNNYLTPASQQRRNSSGSRVTSVASNQTARQVRPEQRANPQVTEFNSLPPAMATTSSAPVPTKVNRNSSSTTEGNTCYWYDPKTLTPRPMDEIFPGFPSQFSHHHQHGTEYGTSSPNSQTGSMALSLLSESDMERLFMTPRDRELYANVKTVRQSVERTDKDVAELREKMDYRSEIERTMDMALDRVEEEAENFIREHEQRFQVNSLDAENVVEPEANLIDSVNVRTSSYFTGNQNVNTVSYRTPRPLESVAEEPEIPEVPVRIKPPTSRMRRRRRKTVRIKESTLDQEKIEWLSMLRWKHELKRCWRKKELNQWSLAFFCMILLFLEIIVIFAIFLNLPTSSGPVADNQEYSWLSKTTRQSTTTTGDGFLSGWTTFFY